MKSFRLPALALAFAALSGCIRNDLDYPVVFGGFTSFEAEGVKRVDIDNSARTVTLNLEETADLDHVKVTGYALTELSVLSRDIPEYLDLTEPFDVTLTTYQKYPWTIVGVQDIERYVRCEKQVGDAAINVDTRTVILSVTDDQPLQKLTITAMKLGPEGSVIKSTTGTESNFESRPVVTRDVAFPMTLDCVLERTFDVEWKSKITTWTLKAVQITVEMQVQSVVPWCHKADIRAICSGKYPASLEYRKGSDIIWQEVPDVKMAGVGLSATLTGLEPGTDYFVRVKENGSASAEFAFRTDTERQLYNMNFDDWHQEGKVWYPFPSGASQDKLVWDSANKATASFLGSITTPDENFVAVSGEGKKAVKLESTYAVVKFAAGNLFNGQFVALKGLGAELAWGVPFDSKPVALHGYYCYRPAVVDYADAAYKDLLGKNDIGQIRVFITDWEDQFHVLSAEQVFVDAQKDPAIIGYAEKLIDETNDGYVEFTLPIDYRSYRTPKWVVIVVASSCYGDYYTGGRGSTLWVDEFNFVYE